MCGFAAFGIVFLIVENTFHSLYGAYGGLFFNRKVSFKAEKRMRLK